MMIFVLSNSILLSSILFVICGLSHAIWFTVIIILLQTLPDEVHKGRVMGLFFTVIQFYGLGFIVGGFVWGLISFPFGILFCIAEGLFWDKWVPSIQLGTGLVLLTVCTYFYRKNYREGI